MKIIDSHNHFWKYDSFKDAWITDDMAVIKKSFLPSDILIEFKKNNIDGCVAVQADQTIQETYFLLDLSTQYDFIKGVVGWINLKDSGIENLLTELKRNTKLKGFRHIIQVEQDGFMLDTSFLNGVSLLEKYQYTFDILIYPKQLKEATYFVEKFPQLQFIIDHMAKPNIKVGEIEEWEKNIQCIAKNLNVNCKISGLSTEADWGNWDEHQLVPYIDIIVKNFGFDRIIFGSDWPVCLIASTYEKWLSILKKYFNRYTIEQQSKFFSENCLRIYNIN